MALAETALLGVFLKALELGLGALEAKDKWAWSSDDAGAVLKLFGGGKEFLGLFSAPSAAPTDLIGKHTLIATQAFGAACLAHWGGNEGMAPFKTKKSVWASKADKARAKDWEQRLAIAVARLGEPRTSGAPTAAIALLHGVVDNPVASPVYEALWWAFTNESLRAPGEDGPLLFSQPSEKLTFERVFRTEYAEGMAATPGFSSAAFALASDASRMLRELIVRWVSSWGLLHVFGAETRGLPPMPLEHIYVEPRAVHEDPKTNERTEGPVRELVAKHLETSKIVIVRGDFGHGKSLTAKMLALGWARDFLADTAPSAAVPYPVFIRCGEDMLAHTVKPAEAIRHALQRQARELGCDRPREDPAHAPPLASEAVRYLFDGLDEIALGSAEVESLFREVHAMLGEGQKAVVFSRKGVVPPLEKLPKGTSVLDVEPFGDEQVKDWLERWNVLSDGVLVEHALLQPRGLTDLARTPILLFMIAMTWTHETGIVNRSELYEQFLMQIARGKCEHDADSHGPVAEAGAALELCLRDKKLLPTSGTEEEGTPTSRANAMLWLLSRIAWESRRRTVLGKRLTSLDVTNILRDELEFDDTSKDTFDAVKVGVLLVLQTDQHGRNHEILFGHKSFQEFLVARYWDATLERIVGERTEPKRNTVISGLLSAPLLEEDDQAFEFLLERLKRETWDSRRGKLIGFCQDEANSELPRWVSEPHTWRNDQSPSFRLAALAIGSRLKWDGRKSTDAGQGLQLEAGAFAICASILGLALTNRTAILTAPGVNVVGSVNLHGCVISRLDLRGSCVGQLQLGHATVPIVISLARGDDGRPRIFGVGAACSGAALPHASLTSADLVSADFSDADLRFANLTEANLTGSNLMRANLSRASMDRSNLQHANLAGADLSNASLEETNLAGAKLSDAILSDAYLHRAILIAAILTGARLQRVNLTGANLARADLRGAHTTGTNFSGADLRDTRVDVQQLIDAIVDDGTKLSPELREALDSARKAG